LSNVDPISSSLSSQWRRPWGSIHNTASSWTAWWLLVLSSDDRDIEIETSMLSSLSGDLPWVWSRAVLFFHHNLSMYCKEKPEQACAIKWMARGI
jgi:hypothetical protein